MIGSELAPYTNYILDRAAGELDVHASSNALLRKFASQYVRIFGVPEVGAQVRIGSVLGKLPRTASSILDIGCGPGMLLGQLERAFPRANVVGIEIDSDAAEIARRAHARCSIVQGDFLTTEFEPASFDCAISIDVLEHVGMSELPAFVKRVRSVLRPGGCFVVHVPAINQRRHFKRFAHWEHHDHEREGFSADEMTDLLREAGFGDLRVSGTFGYCGSLAWELNMIVAGTAFQAPIFPISLAIAALDRCVPSTRYNGMLVCAGVPA